MASLELMTSVFERDYLNQSQWDKVARCSCRLWPLQLKGTVAPETLYSHCKRWGETRIFARMMVGLVANHREQKTVMIEATYLKAHRTSTSMAVK